ncbi:MAG: histidine phosphatase family protein [Clostridia bacterium]|nr:histidine phosphatase family protein [Clostridia bacterium]
MRLLIIRHGESEADILRVHEGRADFPLTERGIRQAKAMAAWAAKDYSIDRIYASTLKRAAQTARCLSEATGVPVESEPDLMEFNNGLLAGLPFDEADKKYPGVPDLPPDKAVYGQESKVEFRARAEKVLAKLLNRMDTNMTVAVVTHGGMINELTHAFLNLPVADGLFFCTADTGVHEWIVTPNGRRVVQANESAHAKDI